jgi:hypothetical protein
MLYNYAFDSYVFFTNTTVFTGTYDEYVFNGGVLVNNASYYLKVMTNGDGTYNV